MVAILLGFPGGSEVKASAQNAGDLGSIPGSGRSPGRRKWQPTPVFLPVESHRRRSLVSYSPWGCKESDMTEQLHFLFLSHTVSTHGTRNCNRIRGSEAGFLSLKFSQTLKDPKAKWNCYVFRNGPLKSHLLSH